MSTKKLKNDLRDFPNPYDEQYLTDDGKIKMQLFVKDYYTAVHKFYSKLEQAKQDFPNFQDVLSSKDERIPEDFPAVEYCTDVIRWFKRWIGSGGTGKTVYWG